jgi:hypothetical protein
MERKGGGAPGDMGEPPVGRRAEIFPKNTKIASARIAADHTFIFKSVYSFGLTTLGVFIDVFQF